MIDMQKSTAYHPALQLIFLVLLAAIGAVVFAAFGLAAWFIFDPNASIAQMTIQNPAEMNINFFRYAQSGMEIGAYIAGPIAFAYLVQVKPAKYFYFNKPAKWSLLILVIAIMFFSMPVLEWVTAVNQKMAFPDALKGVEVWMKQQEDINDAAVKRLLEMKTYTDLLINLLIVSVLTGIGEELLFRGGIQNILGQWFKNHHVAIWVTAMLFSAVHFQFYGFFPRMLLGVLFGYLLIYGKSIWLPILGHAIFNGTSVVMAFVLQQQGGNMEELDQTRSFEWYGYIISAIITVALLIIFFKQSEQESSKAIYG